MCGIAGYQGKVPLTNESIAACASLMKRRGPDNQDSRSWELNGIHTTLLHSRLSIIDLDPRANQPMRHGDNWIVYNGEIYNFVELREELKVAGYHISTQSDTEVLLMSVAHFGFEVLEKCEGMWAFALYHESTGELILSRDRFGEKPLYYLETSTGIFFGSEVKFIAALSGLRLEPNLDQLWRYLINGYKAIYKDHRNSFFNGIREITSGYNLRFRNAEVISNIRYWTPLLRIDEEMKYQDAVIGARDRLIKSVGLRLRADVPLAFCMSGGVDSNALISIAKRVFEYDVHGFTIINKDSRYEESDMIKIAVRELQVRHTAIPVTTDGFLDGLKKLVCHHDSPVYTITYYAQWLLQKAISDAGYRISISGTAADEIFSGYYDHHLAYLNEIYSDKALYDMSVDAWSKYIKPIVRNPHLGNPELFIKNPSFRDHIFFEAEEFSSYLKFDWSEKFSEEIFSKDLLRNRMLNELFYETVPVILHEDDLNSMYYSIENRSPFLDRELFEFCNSIPTRHLIRDGKAKSILREAVRGIAPDAIIENRRKVGFNAPILDYLNTKDPNVRSYLLDESAIFQFVNRDRIESLIQRDDLPNSDSKFLFYFLNCKIFLEEFAD